MRLVLFVALLTPLFGASAASANTKMPPSPGANVSILAAAYGSAKVDVLVGDTVTWRNDSVRAHTVSATDGSWASPRIVTGGVFSRRFAATGVAAYYCQIHPFMRAQVDVRKLLLDAPDDAAVPGQPYELEGRAALKAGSPVTIEAADGTTAATATVDSAGAFHATVSPRSTTSFRAVSGAESSPAVQLLVIDRRVTASARVRGRRAVIKTRVAPASRGATVVLEMRLKERFGWWPVRTAKLDNASRVRFRVELRHAVRARVVLTTADGVTPLVRSSVLRLQPH